MQEQRTLSLLSIWPNLPMSALDGKSPRQAVADPAGQIRVQAVGGIPVKEQFTLFPAKPGKKMAYIAGLPKPKGCV